MNIKLLFGLLLGLLLVSGFASAFEPLSLEVRDATLFDKLFGDDLLAIMFDKGVYMPGDKVNVEIYTNVPSTMAYATLNVYNSEKRYYYANVGHLFSGGTCSYVCPESIMNFAFIAPDERGVYTVSLVFRDGDGEIISSEKVLFSVGVDCPVSYCDDYRVSDADFTRNGELQTMTCYIYDKDTCDMTATEDDRVVCDRGYHLEGGFCVLDSGVAECGNGVRESGEECDAGRSNGFCPSTCSTSCERVACDDLDVPVVGGGSGNSTGDGGGASWVLLALLLLGVVLLGIWWYK